MYLSFSQFPQYCHDECLLKLSNFEIYSFKKRKHGFESHLLIHRTNNKNKAEQTTIQSYRVLFHLLLIAYPIQLADKYFEDTQTIKDKNYKYQIIANSDFKKITFKRVSGLTKRLFSSTAK